METQLSPWIILVVPRPTPAVGLFSTLAAQYPTGSSVIAFSASAAESGQLGAAWGGANPVPLAIFRYREDEFLSLAEEIIINIAHQHPGRPLGVLIGDGPEVPGYRELHRDRWNEALSCAIQKACPSAQVFEYSSDWRVRPPRIR